MIKDATADLAINYVADLAQHIKNRIKDQFGVQLHDKSKSTLQATCTYIFCFELESDASFNSAIDMTKDLLIDLPEDLALHPATDAE